MFWRTGGNHGTGENMDVSQQVTITSPLAGRLIIGSILSLSTLIALKAGTGLRSFRNFLPISVTHNQHSLQSCCKTYTAFCRLPAAHTQSQRLISWLHALLCGIICMVCGKYYWSNRWFIFFPTGCGMLATIAIALCLFCLAPASKRHVSTFNFCLYCLIITML